MSDSFVPLIAGPVSAGDAGSPGVRVLAQGQAKSAFEAMMKPNAPPAPSNNNCKRPTVTLQKQGDVVSGIRIECTCGQVIELECSY